MNEIDVLVVLSGIAVLVLLQIAGFWSTLAEWISFKLMGKPRYPSQEQIEALSQPIKDKGDIWKIPKEWSDKN